ncbi:hypothetical protein RSAG8_08185, partial [Rhizoctonia solani AG-8 WAC10335]
MTKPYSDPPQTTYTLLSPYHPASFSILGATLRFSISHPTSCCAIRCICQLMVTIVEASGEWWINGLVKNTAGTLDLQ